MNMESRLRVVPHGRDQRGSGRKGMSKPPVLWRLTGMPPHDSVRCHREGGIAGEGGSQILNAARKGERSTASGWKQTEALLVSDLECVSLSPGVLVPVHFPAPPSEFLVQ